MGFKPEQADAFPARPDETLITVHDSLKAQAQVNVDTVRDLLAAMNVNDVTLPDALGQAPITAGRIRSRWLAGAIAMVPPR